MVSMTRFEGDYYIETGYGFNTERSTCTRVLGVDDFGRCIMGDCEFIGTWDECVEYAREHSGGEK